MNSYTHDKDVKRLKKEIKGSLIFPNTKPYEESCHIFNRSARHHPAMIVKVRQASDIPRVIYYARKKKLRISVRGGGHSLCGTCLDNNSIVLDMRALNNVKISHLQQRAKVSAGALVRDLDRASASHNMALPLGTCPSVGVIGSTLGGGIGLLSRKYGLTCDNVERIVLVNDEGNFLHVNKENHVDLFWALRGAGANNFGVVTEIEYQLHAIPQQIYGGMISWPLEHGKKILQYYRDLLEEASDDLFIYAFIPCANKQPARLILFGIALNDPRQAEVLFSKMQRWHTPSHINFYTAPYVNFQSVLLEENLATYWKHGCLSSQLSDEFIDAMLACYVNCPNNSGGIALDPMGGAINRVDKAATAFIHRDAQFICSIIGIWPGQYIPENIKTWVKASYETLNAYFNGLAYSSYEDIELNDPAVYYGEHYTRLRKLKAHYDPNNVYCGKLSSNV